MLFGEKLRILAVAAHPDDNELGCGGFLAKCIDNRCDIYYLVLSPCRRHTGLTHAPDTLKNEAMQSTSTLGIKRENVTFYDFENTRFPLHAHEIRDSLEEMRAKTLPDLVLCPSTSDPHQDHATVGAESLRTFRSGEIILTYEVLRHGSYLFNPNLFVDITKYIDKKIEALMCYKSQLKRSYFSPTTFKALAKTRAAQAGYGYKPETYFYAEGFIILKMYL